MRKKKSCIESIKDFFQINPVTLSGALDVIVVENEKKEFQSSAFKLKISKFEVWKPNENQVDIYINGKKMAMQMKLSKRGIAYFQYKTKGRNLLSSYVGGIEAYMRDTKKASSLRKKRLSKMSKDSKNLKNSKNPKLLLSRLSEKNASINASEGDLEPLMPIH